MTNEPTVDLENPPNEANAVGENVNYEPTAEYEKPPIEPTAPEKNATNEPTPAAPSGGSQASEGYRVAGMSEVFRREGEAPPEPARDAKRLSRSFALPERTRGAKRLSRELRLPEMCRSREEAQAKLGPPENGSNPTARDIASMNDGDSIQFHEVFDREKTLEWIQEGLARIAAMRAERLRELTGESRREAQAAKTVRCSRC